MRARVVRFIIRLPRLRPTFISLNGINLWQSYCLSVSVPVSFTHTHSLFSHLFVNSSKADRCHHQNVVCFFSRVHSMEAMLCEQTSNKLALLPTTHTHTAHLSHAITNFILKRMCSWKQKKRFQMNGTQFVKG